MPSRLSADQAGSSTAVAVRAIEVRAVPPMSIAHADDMNPDLGGRGWDNVRAARDRTELVESFERGDRGPRC